jgi:hypothetical protein
MNKYYYIYAYFVLMPSFAPFAATNASSIDENTTHDASIAKYSPEHGHAASTFMTADHFSRNNAHSYSDIDDDISDDINIRRLPDDTASQYSIRRAERRILLRAILHSLCSKSTRTQFTTAAYRIPKMLCYASPLHSTKTPESILRHCATNTTEGTGFDMDVTDLLMPTC